MNIQFSSSNSTTKSIDLTSLPTTHVDKGSKGAGIFLMIFACLWGGIPTAALISSLSSGTVKSGQWGLLIFTVVGTCLFLGGLYLITCRTTTTLSLEKISVLKKSIFGSKQWTEPLSAYEGIRSRSEYHSGGKNSPSYTLYIVELFHRDSTRTVRLYEARTNYDFRKIWEQACQKLNLPAVEGEGTTLTKRAVEDLDKSVRELAQEGKLKVDFNPAKPPPAGMSLKADGAILEVSLTKKKTAGLFGMIIAIIIPGIFIYLGFFVKKAPLAFGIFGSIFLLIMLAILIWNLITTEQLRIGKDEIHIRNLTPWGPTNGTRVNASSVETVRIGQKDGQGLNGILIETDYGTTQVGAGLSAEGLEWLKACILKVIAS